ncbi:lysine-specific histone demethylase 1 homolog 1 [Plakobranchus ocellatus]|uniref:Amine oxidase n=1 Tax=Plakobranchus ocellatus TaxID=259542 RepID=A0AAV4C513_9GAST|nr:lysine-specific histone demethylase 1 homolog 1 [Plakobranchus ocellatus]
MRRFLILLLALSFGYCLDLNNSSKFFKGTDRNKDSRAKFGFKLPKDVAVIGAGMAGLAAARKLTADRSNFNVQVYEARRERFGGRVWTDKLTNIKAKGPEVDLGGSAFIVANKNNPLVELAEDFELKSVNIGQLQFLIPWEKRVISGKELTTISMETSKIFEQALNESKTSKIEMSVREAIDLVLKSGKIATSDSPSGHLIRCASSYILEDYSTKHYHQSDLLGVDYDRVLVDGMGELTDRLLSGNFGESPLHLNLNKVARQIKIDKERGKVVVRFTDGSQIVSDTAVVAVPLSVISSGDLQFEPALPKSYQEAAKQTAIASENKVIVEFEHAFWPKEFGIFMRAVQKKEERGYLQTWVNINHIVDVPALSGLLVGTSAEDFEKLSDEEAEKAVLHVLSEMFGDALLSKGGKIVRLQRSAWVSDHWSKGAATYARVGSSPAMWDVFSEPLCPGVYFAGEHTSFINHGTLHGAYISGLRAANQIQENLCEQKRLQEQEEEEKQQKAAKSHAEGQEQTQSKDKTVGLKNEL